MSQVSGSRRSRIFPSVIMAAALALLPACLLLAAEPLVVKRPAGEAGGDSRFDYYWQLLAQALELTEPDFGAYEIRQGPDPLDEQRAFLDLANDTGRIDVLVHGNVRDYETRLRPIRIPLDKGLLGYRVFLIRADMQPEFDRVRGLDDLRRYRIGQGRNWGDIEILREAGLTVVEGGGYTGLFRMLAAGRFDLFSRSVTEVVDELAQTRAITPPLAIERHLLLYYPLTRYFYVARSPRGETLAARISAGLERMQRDGSFTRLFNNYLAQIDRPIGFRQRLLMRIDNPLLTPETPLARKNLWYDPLRD